MHRVRLDGFPACSALPLGVRTSMQSGATVKTLVLDPGYFVPQMRVTASASVSEVLLALVESVHNAHRATRVLVS